MELSEQAPVPSSSCTAESSCFPPALHGSSPQALLLQRKVCTTTVSLGTAEGPGASPPLQPGAPRYSFLPRFSPSVCCSRGLAVLALSRTGQAGHRAALTAPHRDSHQPLGSDSWNTGNQERERPSKCPATLACRACAGYPGMRGKAGGPLARGEAGAGPW